jgi:hypothetical protein
MGSLERRTTFIVEIRSVKILNHKNTKTSYIQDTKYTNRGMSIGEIVMKPTNIARGKIKISEFTKKYIIMNYVTSTT